MNGSAFLEGVLGVLLKIKNGAVLLTEDRPGAGMWPQCPSTGLAVGGGGGVGPGPAAWGRPTGDKRGEVRLGLYARMRSPFRMAISELPVTGGV